MKQYTGGTKHAMNNENKCHDCGRAATTLHPVMRPLEGAVIPRKGVVGVCDECKNKKPKTHPVDEFFDYLAEQNLE